MKNDMEGFKRIASDSKTMTLKHPQGHQIKVAINALSKPMRDKLMAIPQHFADGGEVENESADYLASQLAAGPSSLSEAAQAPLPPDVDPSLLNAINVPPPAQAPVEMPVEAAPVDAAPVDHSQMIHESGSPFQVPVVNPMRVAPTASAQPAMAAAQPAAPVANPALAPGSEGLKTLMSGIGQEKAGMAAEAKAVGELGLAKEKILRDEAVANDTAIQAYKENNKAYSDVIDSYADDVKNQHLDPNRYMANMSTGQKIKTVIGLIVGGMGAGLLHQDSAALKQLNQTIANDIDAQKMEFSKKDNLLKANLMKFGNMNDAIKVTTAMMNATASLNMQAEEAKAQDPLAKARLQQARGKLDQQTYSIIDQMSRQKAIMAAAGSAGHDGQLSSMDPAKLISLIPAHDQKQAREELQKAAEIKEMAERAMANWDKVNEANTVEFARNNPKRYLTGGLSNQLGADIAHINVKVTHRFNPEENKVLKKQFEPVTAEGMEDRAMKRAAFGSWVSGGRDFPTLRQYSIDPDKYEATALRLPPSPMAQAQQIDSQKHMEYAAWAKKNPNDPLAQKYLQKIGGK